MFALKSGTHHQETAFQEWPFVQILADTPLSNQKLFCSYFGSPLSPPVRVPISFPLSIPNMLSCIMHQAPGAQVYLLSPDGARVSLWAQLSRTASLQGRASSSASAPSTPPRQKNKAPRRLTEVKCWPKTKRLRCWRGIYDPGPVRALVIFSPQPGVWCFLRLLETWAMGLCCVF